MKNTQISDINHSASKHTPTKSNLNINLNVYDDSINQAHSEINVLELIQLQFEQLKTLNHKRSFMMREIAEHLIK